MTSIIISKNALFLFLERETTKFIRKEVLTSLLPHEITLYYYVIEFFQQDRYFF